MEFLVGMITVWIVGPLGLVIGAVGGMLLVRFKDSFPSVIAKIIDFIANVE